MPNVPSKLNDFESLKEIVRSLRSEQGCPWDKEQTHQTLSRFVIEEAYELAEAIDSGLDQKMVEELGDLLLQVVLHSEIARQAQRFDIHEVIEGICQKMVRRHPHVFGDLKVSGSEEVLDNWTKIKAQEKGQSENKADFGLPQGISALIAAHKIGERTRKFNFDWTELTQVMGKVEEELHELKKALAIQNPQEIEHEIGDLLFTVGQLARHLKLDGESALRKANHRFQNRFKNMIKLCEMDNRDFAQLSEAELDDYWNRVKSIENAKLT